MKEQKRSRATFILASALVVSLLACGVLAYLWIDRSLTLAYLQVSMNSTVQERDLMTALLLHEWADLSESEVLQRLQAEAARRPQEDVLVKPDPVEHSIAFGSTTQFVFQGGRLVKIR